MRTLQMNSVWEYLLKEILFQENVDEVIYNPNLPEEARFVYFKKGGATNCVYLLQKNAKRVRSFIAKIRKRKDLALDTRFIDNQELHNLGFSNDIKKFLYIPNNEDPNKAFVSMYVDKFFIIQDRINKNEIHLTPHKKQAMLLLTKWEKELFPNQSKEESEATKRMVLNGLFKIYQAL